MGTWGTSKWGESRWSSLDIAGLLITAPLNSGLPIGKGDWRLVVEIALPEVGSGVWGISKWDESTWSRLGWTDITAKVRGLEWTRGSDEVFGRPRVGQIALTLENNDGELDPWTAPSAAYLAPGTVIRAGLTSSTGITHPVYGTVKWLPQWAGIVESWTPRIADTYATDRWVEIRLNETLRDLAQVDDIALTSPVGSGDTALERFERLIASTGSWSYGLVVEAQNVAAGAYTLQSTDLAANRLAELYLTADSSDSQFRSVRDGRAGVTASEYISLSGGDADPIIWPLVLSSYYDSAGSTIPILYLDRQDSTIDNGTTYAPVVAYRPESFQSMNQDTEISNNVTLAGVGRAQQNYRQEASINRFGERSYVRSDLLNNEDASPALFAQYISIRRALATLRLEALTIDTADRPLPQFLATVSTEPGDRVFIYPPIQEAPPVPVIYGFVAAISHRVSPRVSSSSMNWESSIRADTRTVFNIPGAQLPAT